MSELLHSWAIAPAAIGACCLAADRGRTRWPDAAAAMLMLLAMLDAALTHVVSPVYWSAILLAFAMASAAWRRPRRGPAASPAARDASRMAVHTGLGMVAMAALQLGMSHEPVTASAGVHAHGGDGAMLGVVLLGGAVAYTALSARLVARSHRALDRAQVACMAASVLVMAVGTAIPWS